MASFPSPYPRTTSASGHAQQPKTIRVPGRSQRDGYAFLESVGSGTLLGTGSAYLRDLEKLRLSYHNQIAELASEVNAMQTQGASAEKIAAFANAGRNRILLGIRLRQNLGAAVTLDLRDRMQYGIAGRSYKNMLERAKQSALRTDPAGDPFEIMTAGALRSNAKVTGRVARATEFLGRGGTVLSVLGLAASGYEIYEASPENRTRVIEEQAGSTAMSWAASGGAVALCVVLGVGTGGVGLLAIGLAAGIAGGATGTWLGDKFYYSTHPHAAQHTQDTGWIEQHLFHSHMP